MNMFTKKLNWLIMSMMLMVSGSAWAGDVTDVLNYNFIGTTGTIYKAFSGKTGTSGAVYAGQSAGGSSSIQLRTKDNNSGIVTTTSGGKVKSITITFNNATAEGRIVNVYGKNTAYEDATDLYDTKTSGDELGSIAYGSTSTSLTIDGDYTFIGLRSSSGALYLDEVQITWETSGETPPTPTKEEAGLAYTETEFTIDFGDDFTAPTLTNPYNLTVSYASDNTDVATVADNGDVTIKGVGTATITASFAGNDDYKAGSASYTLTVNEAPVVPVEGEKTDVLNNEFIGNSGTTYQVFSEKTGSSGAVYAGQSAGGNSSIQLRSNSNNSGIVTTTSGGKVKSITITFNSATSEGRTVDVYGKNTPYEAATDLYNTSKRGTLLGSAAYDGNTTSFTIDIDEDYTFIGLRSNSGALYLDEVQITWETSDAPQKEAAGLAYTTTEFTINLGDEFTAPTLTNPNNLTVSYASSNEEVAMVDEATGEVVLMDAAGETTITASFAGDDNYYEGSASYTLTVVDANAPGTANNPYTVAEALAFIETLGTETSAEVYVSGIISQIDEVSTTHGNATYYISDDGTTESQLEVYRGKFLNNAAFTSESQIAVGDEVTVYGKLKNFKGTTPEFDQGNYIVELVHNGKVDIATINSLTPTEVEVGAEGTFEVDVTLADGLTEEDYDISFTSSDENVIVVDANTGEYIVGNEPGTVTITVRVDALDEDAYNNVEKEFTVTVTDPGTADQKIIDLTGATASISFSDFSKAGSSYTTGIQGAFPASNGKAYIGWVKKDCSYNATNHEILQMKKNAGTLTSPTIKSDKGIKVIVTYGSSSGITLQIGESSITGKAGGNYENTSSSVELSSPATETTFIISAGSNAAYISSIEIVPLTDADLVETIKVGPAGYATYVTKNAVEFKGVKAYAVTAINEKSVSLQELTSAPAGTPVVVEAAEGEYTCTIIESAEAPEKNLLTYSEEEFESDGTIYALANKDEVGFYPVKSGVKVPAGKAYLVVGAEVKGFLALGDLADAINNILVETANGNIFNIAGQKVQNITKGGLYIVNGKKVFVK